MHASTIVSMSRSNVINLKSSSTMNPHCMVVITSSVLHSHASSAAIEAWYGDDTSGSLSCAIGAACGSASQCCKFEGGKGSCGTREMIDVRMA